MGTKASDFDRPWPELDLDAIGEEWDVEADERWPNGRRDDNEPKMDGREPDAVDGPATATWRLSLVSKLSYAGGSSFAPAAKASSALSSLSFRSKIILERGEEVSCGLNSSGVEEIR